MKLKLPSALVVALALSTQANAQAPNPFPQSGTITLDGKQVSYTHQQNGNGRVYYTVAMPTKTLGQLPFTLPVPTAGVTTPAQAQATIQLWASRFWGSLVLPLPY